MASDWLAVIPATIAASASLLASIRNGKRITVVHALINSRLSELLELTKKESFSAGQLAGSTKERDRGEKTALDLISHDEQVSKTDV
jgi:hypothetical protein